MEQRVPLRQRRDLSQIISHALALYSRHFAAFFSIAAIVIPLGIASGIFQARIRDDNIERAMIGLLLPVQLAVDALASAAFICALIEIESGRVPEFGAAYDGAFGRIASLIGSLLRVAFHVLLFAITIVGLPWAIQRIIRWLFVEQAVMLEGATAKDSLRISAGAVEGQWWRTLGCWLVIWLIAVLPVAVASGVARLTPILVGSIVSATAAALILPFFITAQTLLYFDLKLRKEPHDIASPA